jgi:hypothetical protein
MFIVRGLQTVTAPLGAECKLNRREHCAPLEHLFLNHSNYKHLAPSERFPTIADPTPLFVLSHAKA